MRDGKYHAKEAALRMKQDLANPNPQMWDIFAYRVVEDDDGNFYKHMRAGDKWKILSDIRLRSLPMRQL